MRHADAPPAPDRPAVTLLGRDGCVATETLRALLESLGVPYAFVPLNGAPADTPGGDGAANACGFVSPTVQIANHRGAPDLLIQPSIPAVVDALRGRGLVAHRSSAARALAA